MIKEQKLGIRPRVVLNERFHKLANLIYWELEWKIELELKLIYKPQQLNVQTGYYR